MATGAEQPPSPAALEVLQVLIGGGHHYPWEKSDIGPTPAADVSASRVINAGDLAVLVGYSITEASDTGPAAIRLRDGNTNAGEVICRINLLPSESIRDTFSPVGIRVFTGHLFIEVLAGVVEGVVFWKPKRDGNYYE